MRRLTAIAIILFMLGIVLLAYSVYSGEANVYVFLIIPVFQSSSPFAIGGMALVLVAIFLFFFSLATPLAPEYGETVPATSKQAPRQPSPQIPQQRASKKFGGVVLLGPIPIVFGSDKRIAKWMLVLALVIIILSFILIWYFGTQI